MVTKAYVLSKLDEEQLRIMAQKQGLAVIPKTFKKRELIKYLEGLLTIERINEHSTKVYEKEIKHEIIRETVHEKGIRIKEKVVAKVKFEKKIAIKELMSIDERIDSDMFEELANYLHAPIPHGEDFSLYNSMSQKMLEEAYRIFAMKENDHKGRYLEFRFANFLKLKYERELARIKIRKKVPNVGELDIVGLDSENHYCLMAECKDRPIRYEDVDKWLINIRRLYDLYGNRIKRAFIVGSKGYTPETLKRVEDLKNIDKKGRLNFIEGVTVTKAYHFAKWFADPNRPTNSDELDKVYIGLYDVREGKFNQVFP